MGPAVNPDRLAIGEIAQRSVRQFLGNVRIERLQQVTAAMHIEHLQASADAEDRQGPFIGRLQPGPFQHIAGQVIARDMSLIALIAGRVDIEPASEEETVGAFAGQPFRRPGQAHRPATTDTDGQAQHHADEMVVARSDRKSDQGFSVASLTRHWSLRPADARAAGGGTR